MDYYRCPNAELIQEVTRRGYTPRGNQDELSEGLQQDDDMRGSEATTINTLAKQFVPPKVNLLWTAQFGTTIHASLLVGERIVHWNMNTFFPSLQLFFDSGLSCTIDGGRLPDAMMGLDPKLRFRLTDITHEEDGRLVKTVLPEKFAGATPSIGILGATMACRTSIAVKHRMSDQKDFHSSVRPQATIVQEHHMVVGLRLEGLKQMSYVWAKVPCNNTNTNEKTWSDVRIAGLRDDAPTPFFGFPQEQTKAGSEVVMVMKGSMIHTEEKKKDLG